MEAGTFDHSARAHGTRAQSTSGTAVASLVLGILAVLLFVLWASLIFGPLAIVFGVMGRRDSQRDPATGGFGLATAGLVLGITGMALTLVFAAIGFAAL